MTPSGPEFGLRLPGKANIGQYRTLVETARERKADMAGSTVGTRTVREFLMSTARRAHRSLVRSGRVQAAFRMGAGGWWIGRFLEVC